MLNGSKSAVNPTRMLKYDGRPVSHLCQMKLSCIHKYHKKVCLPNSAHIFVACLVFCYTCTKYVLLYLPFFLFHFNNLLVGVLGCSSKLRQALSKHVVWLNFCKYQVLVRCFVLLAMICIKSIYIGNFKLVKGNLNSA